MNTNKDYKKIKWHKCDQLNARGNSSPIFTFGFLEPYITSHMTKIDASTHFRYTDYVHKILNYPSDLFIYTSISLHVLCKMLTNFFVLVIQHKKKKAIPHKFQKNYGGSCSPFFNYAFVKPYFCTDKTSLDPSSKFQYVDHTDSVGILAYPEGEYIHTNIPLLILFEILSLTKARKLLPCMEYLQVLDVMLLNSKNIQKPIPVFCVQLT